MRYFSRDGLTFDVDDSGPSDGPAVVLLHGWPQDRTSWHRVAPGLVDAGMRVLAPDLRGYSPGAAPPHHHDYAIEVLVEDVTALLDAAGVERAHVVGHDWGGALAWAVAARRPERVASLTVLSTPSPSGMAHGVRHGDQLRRSAYMAFFALPVLPILFFRLFAQQVLERLGMPRERAVHDAARLKRPGGAVGPFSWYRAALSPTLAWRRSRRRAQGGAPVGTGTGSTAGSARPVPPTAYLWGTRDPAFSATSTEHTVRRLRQRAGDRAEELVDTRSYRTGHWLPETHSEEIVDAVLGRVAAADRIDPAA